MANTTQFLPKPSRQPVIWLPAISVANALIYAFIFYKPANFLRVAARSRVYQDYLYVSPPSTRWWMVAALISLGILYGIGWYIARRADGPAAWVIVLCGSLAFGILLSYIYPIDASDLFNYIMDGRILSVHGDNPYVQVPNLFKSDTIFPLVSWSNYPTVYGPLWELLAAGVTRLAGGAILANVLAFKWLAGMFMFACTGVIAIVLHKQGAKNILSGTLMFAWNPIVLYETWGNGHNDVVMVFFILLAVGFVLRQRHIFVMLALTAGMLVKFIPILLVPAAGLIALRDLVNWRARARYLVITLISVALLVYFAYMPFWNGFKVLTFMQRSGFFTSSLPAMIYRVSIPLLGRDQAASLISISALILTIIFALWQAVRAWQNPSIYSFPQASFNILTFYLLVTYLWFQQWYSVWLIGLAPLLASGGSQLFAVLFGFLAIGKQFFLFPLVYWSNPRPAQPRLEITLTLGVLGLPWLLAISLLLWKRMSLRLRRAT